MDPGQLPAPPSTPSGTLLSQPLLPNPILFGILQRRKPSQPRELYQPRRLTQEALEGGRESNFLTCTRQLCVYLIMH